MQCKLLIFIFRLCQDKSVAVHQIIMQQLMTTLLGQMMKQCYIRTHFPVLIILNFISRPNGSWSSWYLAWGCGWLLVCRNKCKMDSSAGDRDCFRDSRQLLQYVETSQIGYCSTASAYGTKQGSYIIANIKLMYF